MILRVILPTTEIIRAHRHKAWLVEFYDEGIRGLVRDTVLHQRYQTAPYFCEAGGDVAMLEEVIRQYESSLDFRFLENTLGQCYPTSQVEGVVVGVADDVAQMMRDFFTGHAYDVCKLHWQWLEEDLIVSIHLQDPPCKRVTSISSLVLTTLFPTGIRHVSL